jgi:hypothetical protein
LDTRRKAELDSDFDWKGEWHSDAMTENISSGTRRAGDKISERISSGMLSPIVFQSPRKKAVGIGVYEPNCTTIELEVCLPRSSPVADECVVWVRVTAKERVANQI